MYSTEPSGRAVQTICGMARPGTGTRSVATLPRPLAVDPVERVGVPADAADEDGDRHDHPDRRAEPLVEDLGLGWRGSPGRRGRSARGPPPAGAAGPSGRPRSSPVIAVISPRPGLARSTPADSTSIPTVVCKAIWLKTASADEDAGPRRGSRSASSRRSGPPSRARTAPSGGPGRRRSGSVATPSRRKSKAVVGCIRPGMERADRPGRLAGEELVDPQVDPREVLEEGQAADRRDRRRRARSPTRLARRSRRIAQSSARPAGTPGPRSASS